MTRGRTRATTESKKAAIANQFRGGIMVECEQYDAEQAVVNFLGVELAEVIDPLTAGINKPEDASPIDAPVVNATVEYVIGEGE